MRLFSCLLLVIVFAAGCANIVPPTGGKKDVTPPKLLGVTPEDSLLNKRVTEIELRFDEFVTLNDATKEIQMSPVLPFPLNAIVIGKKVRVEIPDSLLKDNTTYRLSFGNAIKDLHEANPFNGYDYMFSTGSYFDSLQLNGYVQDAATGKPAENAKILLYDAELSDSAVVRKKPEYIFTAAGGNFIIKGLPAKKFRVYALVEENGNMVFDDDKEKIAFVDSFFSPTDSLVAPIELRVFKEIPVVDSSLIEKEEEKKSTTSFRDRKKKDDKDKKVFKYSVNVDTSNAEKRTFDVNKPIKITFNIPIDTYDLSKISLSYDSTETAAEIQVSRDTADNVLLINSDWLLDKVYTLRLQKDFLKDTSGLFAHPSKHIFRTQSEDDYGIIYVNVSQKFYGKKYLMMVTMEKDTVYKEPITDTTVTLKRMVPGSYALWIIIDENQNGKWDTGNLFAKKQPEVVIPHNTNIELKASWENVIDFTEPLHEEEGEKGGLKSRKGAEGDK